jgi:O-antigen ligase
MFKYAQPTISIGLALFLIIGATVRSGASSIAFLLFLLSLFWLYQFKNTPTQPLSRLENFWVLSVFLLNIVVFLSSYEYKTFDISAIDALTRFLFAIPVFFLVRRVGLNLSIILFGGAIGAVLMGLYAYYQLNFLGLLSAVGMTDHNYFGQLSLLLSFFALCGFAYYQNRTVKWWFLLATFVGLYAILTSGSRGVWIALPAIVVLMFRYHLFAMSFFKKTVTLLAFIILLVSVYFSNTFLVKDRVDTITNETVNYFTKNEVSGSAGLRLEMWRASLIIIKDSYGLGAGEHGYRDGVLSLLAQNKVHPKLINFTVEPHNYYLKTLVAQGLVGIILLFLILFIPMRAFLQYLSLKSIHKAQLFNPIMGVGVIVAYLDFMMSNTTLDVQLMSVFLAFTLFPLLGNLHFERQQGMNNET